jgi:hypothetical protein
VWDALSSLNMPREALKYVVTNKKLYFKKICTEHTLSIKLLLPYNAVKKKVEEQKIEVVISPDVGR